MGKRDIWVFAGLLAFALIFFIIFLRTQGTAGSDAEARITLDGQVVKTVDLSKNAEFALEQNPDVKFAVRNGAVAFVESSCPDKVCIHAGFLNRPGQMAACLPNRVGLSIIGEIGDDGIDAVAN